VTPQTVSKWRKALGVPQVNEGTARLYREYAPERLTEDVRKRALAAANGPEANAKKAAFRLGKPAHPRARAALARYWGRSPSPETRQKMSEAHRRRGTRPPKAGRPWSREEEQLLGRLPDREVAARTGRTVHAVRGQRQRLGIPSFHGSGGEQAVGDNHAAGDGNARRIAAR
jgi:hypothetical protein